MQVTPDSKVLVQGITEPLGLFHAARMKAYGTNVVAGVSPGQGGKAVYDIPVFDLVEQALSSVGPVDTSIIFTPRYQALDAALEAMAAGIRQIIIITCGIPPLDRVQLVKKAQATKTLVLGPSCSGIIVPGKVLLGIHATQFYTPGCVGIISRSGSLTDEVALELSQSGLGQSISVGMGNGAIAGSSFLQWLPILDKDKKTEAIVLVGQTGIGGEEAAAEFIAECIDKPVIAYIAGRHAPGQKYPGEADAIITAQLNQPFEAKTAEGKIAAFKKAKIPVAVRPSQIPQLVKKALKK